MLSTEHSISNNDNILNNGSNRSESIMCCLVSRQSVPSGAIWATIHKVQGVHKKETQQQAQTMIASRLSPLVLLVSCIASVVQWP